MEFATVSRRRPTKERHATGSSPARRPHAHAAAIALQSAWTEAEPRLRATYAQALEAHAADKLDRAQQLYESILTHALLDPAGLRPPPPVAGPSRAAAAAAALSADADEAALACAIRRLTLRSLALSNAAALAQQQASGSAEADDSDDADAPANQPTEEQRKGLQRSLRLHLDALEAGSTLTQLRDRFEREKLRFETGTAAAATAADSTPAISATRGVTDASLWLRTARAALALDQLPLARTSLENAFRLRSDSWPVVHLLLDVLYALSDWSALQLMVQHALSFDPWHVRAMLMQRHLWAQRYPDSNAADSHAFAELDARLHEQVQPEELQAAERHLAALQRRYNRQSASALSSDEQPQLLVRRWDCTVETPSFAGLAQQLVTLYAEVTDLVRPEDPQRSVPCAMRDGKFVPLQAQPGAPRVLLLLLLSPIVATSHLRVGSPSLVLLRTSIRSASVKPPLPPLLSPLRRWAAITR